MRGVTHPSLSGYLADERGNLTMEFVLWLPILMFWFVISAVFYDAYKSRDDAAKASYTIADIVSRETQLTVSRIEELVDLQRALLPRAGRTMFLRLSSISCDRTGGCTEPATAAQSDYELNWSILPPNDGWPGTFPDKPVAMSSSSDIPLGSMPLMAEGDTIILIDVSVPFEPFSDWVGVDAREWIFRVPVWPRLVSEIDLTPPAITQFVDNGGGYLGS